ncbi:4Fe-4S binding protein [Anaerobranca gottschalkii]|uniref:4Fe-4S binding domain-containing protein n=1 Tax=Anaerobranca gottschalkii DSM 13577 TaxID=1120990 RepID=A0A1H9ZTZ9_9FIRM|nr:4Fe-4S binding protein [Anaerobranca gottschalkii]SES84300.1 4Fe-4S binding domain-containing protein [Anaerobranca gottschalkii DSM 13577]
MIAYIKPSKCDKSPFCPAKRVCPVNAIYFDETINSYKVDEEKCIGCGKCAKVCPQRAIEMI